MQTSQIQNELLILSRKHFSSFLEQVLVAKICPRPESRPLSFF